MQPTKPIVFCASRCGKLWPSYRETRTHPAMVQGLSTISPSQTASTPRETSLVSGFTSGTPTGIKETMEKPLSPKTATGPKTHGEITYPFPPIQTLKTCDKKSRNNKA